MEFVNRKVNLEEDILVIDKPAGWTSHDVVAKIRKEIGLPSPRLRRVKVGHGGTLDPFATGLLLILIGKATRRFDEIRTWEKEYEMTVRLGTATDTGDPTGKVVKTTRRNLVGRVQVDEQNIKKVLKSFVPGYEQQVPAFSAVKINGRRAYKLARAGERAVMPKRRVKIKLIRFISLQGSTLKCRVVCGSGTYMRQLAIDIGKKLDLPAYCKSLCRLRVGKFKLSA